MRTFAPLNLKAESTPKHLLALGRSREVPKSEKVRPVSFFSAPMIHCKVSCACGGGCPACLGKSGELKVSQPNDPAEIEADQIADKVMRMPAGEGINTAAHPGRFRPTETTGPASIQPRHTSAFGGTTVDGEIGGRINSSRGGGTGLDPANRGFMEARFKVDFSGVKIHTDEDASLLNHALGAKAFTIGNDIYFKDDAYRPHPDMGRHLLAHELTHVTQQGNLIRPYRDPKSKGTFNFGTADTATLVEDSFSFKTDKKIKPWIELISVKFTSKTTDSYGDEYWVGTGAAQYYDNPVKKPDLSLNLSGGPTGKGKTKSGTFKVNRIEGVGYMSSKYSEDYERAAEKGKGRRYKKDTLGNMNFAVFFYGGQALHSGPVNLSSHGCVHVDWTDETNMQQMNYYSVVGLTKVKVEYS